MAKSSLEKLIKYFGIGTTVSVVVGSGLVFTGRIAGDIRHCDPTPPIVTNVESEVDPEYLLLTLTATTATTPYIAGQTIAINVLLIETIG